MSNNLDWDWDTTYFNDDYWDQIGCRGCGFEHRMHKECPHCRNILCPTKNNFDEVPNKCHLCMKPFDWFPCGHADHPRNHDKYQQCAHCDSEDKYVQDYQDSWGFDKKASPQDFCSQCKVSGAHVDTDLHWTLDQFGDLYCPKCTFAHCPECGSAAVTLDSSNDGLLASCMQCQYEGYLHPHCDKCGREKEGSYGQCEKCDNTDEDFRKNYQDSWGFDKEATMVAKIICDHLGCDKEYNGETVFSLGTQHDLPDTWARATRPKHPNDDQNLMADDHFCPEHKDLHCVDDFYYGDGCGGILYDNGTCGSIGCGFRNTDRLVTFRKKREYVEGWGLNKESYRNYNNWGSHFDEIPEEYINCESCGEKILKDEDHDDDPEYEHNLCDTCANRCLRCQENLEKNEKLPFCNKCGADFCEKCHYIKNGEYGQCQRCEGKDEDYLKNYNESWGFDKNASTFHHCDHEGCKKIVSPEDEDERVLWKTDSSFNKKNYTLKIVRRGRDYCPEHKGLYCAYCDFPLEKEDIEAGYDDCSDCHDCGQQEGKYGQCKRCIPDKDYEDEYKDSWTTKQAINYFSLDQPNEAIMPGMAQDTEDSDGLGVGSTANPDPGKDGMAVDSPSMQDYERGLSSAASKGFHSPLGYMGDGYIDCPKCTQKKFPDKNIEEDELINKHGDKLTPLYDHHIGDSDSTYCDTCSDYLFGLDECSHCQDYWRGDEMSWDDKNDAYICPLCTGDMCHKCRDWKNGKYGQCKCEGSDAEYIKNYADSWKDKEASKKQAYYERIAVCDGCDLENPNHDEYPPSSWVKATDKAARSEYSERGYNRDLEKHFCPDCKNDYCVDRWNGWDMANSGCGEPLGKFGQCTGCVATDQEYKNNYSQAWGFDENN